MPSLFRLLAPKPRTIERESLELELPDGRTINLQRVRDPRARRLRLSVDERGARLTLPLRASLATGERFVAEHGDWLTKQLARFQLDGVPALERDVSTQMPLRGAMLPLLWQQGRFAHLQHESDGEALMFTLPSRAGDSTIRRVVRDFYEAQARADVGRWLPRLLADLPRAPRRITFKMMSSQWGSLAPDGSMALDLSLVLGEAERVRVRAGARAVPPDPRRSFARVLARGRDALPALARGARLLPCRGPSAEGDVAGVVRENGGVTRRHLHSREGGLRSTSAQAEHRSHCHRAASASQQQATAKWIPACAGLTSGVMTNQGRWSPAASQADCGAVRKSPIAAATAAGSSMCR